MKKRIISFMLTMVMLLSLMPAVAYADDTAGTFTISYDVEYGQTESRSMLDMINEFRTGDEAWYWNEDDTTKTELTGLSELVYDYDLEQIAMQRAAEIALAFSHTRPNSEKWISYTYNGTQAYGENIAAGTGVSRDTAAEAFEAWQENDDMYSGQGHRRNMLKSDFKAVGIGHAYLNGTHYWVQEFSYYISSSSATEAVDEIANVEVPVDTEQVSSASFTLSSDTIKVEKGETTALPTVNTVIKLADTWPSSKTVTGTVRADWISADTSVAKIADGKVTGVGDGKTELSATIGGQTLTAQCVSGEFKIDLVGIELDRNTIEMSCGETAQLTVDKNPSNTTNTSDVTWSTSNAAIATISNDGTVTAVTEGTAQITAVVDGFSAACNVTVSHKYGDWITDVEPTCTETGVRHRVCSGCSATEKDSLTAFGHDWENDYTVDLTATTKHEGSKSYHCAACDEINEDSVISIPKIKTISLSYSTYTYNGKIKTPTVIVKDEDGQELIKDTDYTVTYGSGRKKVGSYEVTIDFQGDYSGSVTKTFKIVKASQQITASNKSLVIGSSSTKLGAKRTFGNGGLTYTSSNKKVATISSTGKITPKTIGKTTITITAKETSNYKKTVKKVTVTVIPKGTSLTSVKSSKNGQITVKWSKKSDITGYQIRYSPNSDMSGSSIKTISGKSSTSKTITGLTKGKKYYVQVRTYKTVSGTKYCSTWSSKKYVTTLNKTSSTGSGNSSTAANTYVWISATGTKYHAVPDCGTMNPDNATKITKSKAQSSGYEPCKKCF